MSVDDHPMDLSQLVGKNIRTFESLGSFEKAYKQKQISADSLIIFDLHLEEGRCAFEVLPDLNESQDYLFMTSDYLNPDLQLKAKQRQFLTIPKELIDFGLKHAGQSAIAKAGLGPIEARSEMQVQT